MSHSTPLNHASKSNPCPICDRPDWCYELSDDLWCCKRSDFAPAGWRKTGKHDREGHAYFGSESSSDSLEWLEKKAEWDQRKAEREESKRLADIESRKGGLTASERDPLIRKLSQDLGLSRTHQRLLLDRGFTQPQIKDGLFFSIEKWQKISNDYPLNLPGVYLSKFGDRQLNGEGIAIVAFDAAGLATGWQVMAVPRIDGAKYFWAKGDKSSHLPVGNGEGELPIQVTGIPGKKKVAYFCEGVLKSRLAALNLNQYTIGASSGNFSGSPTLVTAALEGIKTVVIPIDAGEVTNPARMAHWCRQYDFLVSLGVNVKFLWWGQWSKKNNDIDEISVKKFTNARVMNLDQFLKLPAQAAQRIADKILSKKLSSLTLPVDYLRSEQYLSGLIPLKPGTIGFISSPCNTGKTEQLSNFIKAWEAKYPLAKTFVLGYRNGLLDQIRKRLDISSYRVGHGQDEAAINSFKRIAICLDSILKLQLDSIPANSLIIFDEFEAILKHGTLGGTLGKNRASVQAHVIAVVDRVLSTGGIVLGLEDSLTDLAINGFMDLLGRKYPCEILKNTVQKFHWDVRMGGGNPADFIGLIIDRLKRGESLVIPSTSQRFIEAVERMVLSQLPELAGKIVRLDAKTSPDLHNLLADPNKWLAHHPTRLLFLSPTVESGFSIDVREIEHWFNRVMIYVVNLDTRCHIQMLSRDRSNIPRDIFVQSKGAEVGSDRGRDPVALLKMRKVISNEANLLHGVGEVPITSQGAVWNRLDAEFSARSALSSKYLAEFLEDELIDRGHNVTQVDWEAVRIEENAKWKIEDAITREEISFVYKETKVVILREENNILFNAKGKEIDVAQAQAILHSSSSRFEQKQQAIKCLLHDRLPLAPLTEEFLMETWTKNRGAYLKQCELSWLVEHPELAKHIDRAMFASQLQQPHVLYSQTSKLALKINLLGGIFHHIQDLATGREYKHDDLAIIAIQQYALKKSKDFFNLFNLNIKAETRLGKGNGSGSTQNSPIATANKLIKLLGYNPKLERREGKAGEQVSIYKLSNFDCSHRKEVYKSIDYKHKDYLADPSSLKVIALVVNTVTNLKTETMKDSSSGQPKPSPHPEKHLSKLELENVQSATDTLSAIAALPVEEAIEVLAHFRSTWTVELLTSASRNLTFVERSAIKKLVIQMNDLIEAS